MPRLIIELGIKVKEHNNKRKYDDGADNNNNKKTKTDRETINELLNTITTDDQLSLIIQSIINNSYDVYLYPYPNIHQIIVFLEIGKPMLDEHQLYLCVNIYQHRKKAIPDIKITPNILRDAIKTNKIGIIQWLTHVAHIRFAYLSPNLTSLGFAIQLQNFAVAKFLFNSINQVLIAMDARYSEFYFTKVLYEITSVPIEFNDEDNRESYINFIANLILTGAALTTGSRTIMGTAHPSQKDLLITALANTIWKLSQDITQIQDPARKVVLIQLKEKIAKWVYLSFTQKQIEDFEKMSSLILPGLVFDIDEAGKDLLHEYTLMLQSDPNYNLDTFLGFARDIPDFLSLIVGCQLSKATLDYIVVFKKERKGLINKIANNLIAVGNDDITLNDIINLKFDNDFIQNLPIDLETLDADEIYSICKQVLNRKVILTQPDILTDLYARGYFKILEWLINDKGISLNAISAGGWTLLAYAILEGDFETAEWIFILSCQQNLNAQYYTDTLFNICSEKPLAENVDKFMGFISTLICKGANLMTLQGSVISNTVPDLIPWLINELAYLICLESRTNKNQVESAHASFFRRELGCGQTQVEKILKKYENLLLQIQLTFDKDLKDFLFSKLPYSNILKRFIKGEAKKYLHDFLTNNADQWEESGDFHLFASKIINFKELTKDYKNPILDSFIKTFDLNDFQDEEDFLYENDIFEDNTNANTMDMEESTNNEDNTNTSTDEDSTNEEDSANSSTMDEDSTDDEDSAYENTIGLRN